MRLMPFAAVLLIRMRKQILAFRVASKGIFRQNMKFCRASVIAFMIYWAWIHFCWLLVGLVLFVCLLARCVCVCVIDFYCFWWEFFIVGRSSGSHCADFLTKLDSLLWAFFDRAIVSLNVVIYVQWTELARGWNSTVELDEIRLIAMIAVKRI